MIGEAGGEVGRGGAADGNGWVGGEGSGPVVGEDFGGFGGVGARVVRSWEAIVAILGLENGGEDRYETYTL
jgi:hypothetical protein